MNLNKLLVTSFLVLMISTYQTDSGIIFSLLMKVLLLKGALFMTMPLSIGAFMMGQGMGFFAGNMMGGYMMLRAANRYHNKEKVKWTSGGYGDHGHGYYETHGWTSHDFHNAYDKGKHIGAALHALTSYKTKLAAASSAALHKVKGIFVGYKTSKGWGPSPTKGWGPPPTKGWGSPPTKGWGGGGSYSGIYSSPSHVHDDHEDYHYTSHSKYKPVTTSYKHSPYSHFKSGGSSYSYQPSKGYSGSAASSSGYGHDDIVEVVDDYSNYHPSSSSSVLGSSAYAETVQDPSNTYYTSAYDGPAHEYTGLLTDEQSLDTYSQNAQDKSSENEDYLPYKNLITNAPTTTASFDSAATVSPNPVLEKYLEKRLEEEAAKQKNFQQQTETKQLIQMLRKAYLKQLVDSLKEEANVITSTETPRGSRSIESSDKTNIIQKLLAFKFPKSGEETDRADNDMMFSESVIDPVTAKISAAPDTTSTEQSSSTSTPSTSTTSAPPSPSSSSTPAPSSTSTEYYSSSSTTPVENEETKEEVTAYDESDSDYMITSTEKSSTEFSLGDFMEMPAMWVKAENTFTDETKPFFIRVRRNAQTQDSEAAAAISRPQIDNVQSISDAEKQVTAFVDDIKKFFTLLTVLDQDQCLQKLVCDVHTNQKDPATITPYEQNILTTFRLMKALMPAAEEDSSTKYRRAAVIGETGQSLELCQQSYISCTYSSSQIISLGSEAEASAADWAGAEADAVGSTSKARSDYVTMPKVRRSLRSFYL